VLLDASHEIPVSVGGIVEVVNDVDVFWIRVAVVMGMLTAEDVGVVPGSEVLTKNVVAPAGSGCVAVGEVGYAPFVEELFAAPVGQASALSQVPCPWHAAPRFGQL
jgi:hypothetical protein